MIHKGPANIKAEEVYDSHGGHGSCMVRTLLTSEFDSSLAYVREIVLHANSSVGIHPHSGDEELYYIISGRGIMMVNGEQKVVVSGDVVLTKSGSSHGLRNESDRDLRFFVVCAEL